MSPNRLEYLAKAKTLVEALPWIKEMSGKTIVIKYGGAAMADPELRQRVADDIVLMKLVGAHPVVVHGGGPDITAFSDRLGIETHFKDGMRITPPESMEIVKMVLVGKVNKEIVNAINTHGSYAVGISGEDGGLVKGTPISKEFGRTALVDSVDTTLVDNLLKDDFIPVIATVAMGNDGHAVNVNADLVAGRLATALCAEKCIYLTDVDGIYRDFETDEDPISVLTVEQAEELLATQKLEGAFGGMTPKLSACIDAVKSGVNRAHILNGTIPHSLILEVYTDTGIGTMILEQP